MLNQPQSRLRPTFLRVMLMTVLLTLAALFIALPAQAAAPAQHHAATPTPASESSGGMMGQGMMKSEMSMAEMGAMMDEMMGQMESMMASMPMTGTMPMAEMGQSMYMMGMMHQHMGMMQMQMGMMPMTGTMPMAEMGQSMYMMGMMHQHMGMMQMQMGMMPMTDTMPMAEMGQSMYMMGMMHQHMGTMQMQMGAMMAGHTMDDMAGMMGGGMMDGEMMGKGMMDKSATPSATAPATEDHSSHGAAPEPATTPEPDATPEAAATPEPATTPEAAASPEAAATVDHSGHPAPAMATTPQTATAGAVTIEVAPLTTEDVLDVAFAVTLDTHSVDLGFDLAEHATLVIGEQEFAAGSWTPDAADGHHVTGILRFTIDHPAHGALYTVDEVGLKLDAIDGEDAQFSFALE